MTPTMIDINVALIMVAVNVAIFVWLQRSEAAASTRRMFDMMTRMGLNPGIAVHGDPQTRAVLKQARRRCGRCPCEGHCELWMNGKADTDNDFCPNARTFGSLIKVGGPAA